MPRRQNHDCAEDLFPEKSVAESYAPHGASRFIVFMKLDQRIATLFVAKLTLRLFNLTTISGDRR